MEIDGIFLPVTKSSVPKYLLKPLPICVKVPDKYNLFPLFSIVLIDPFGCGFQSNNLPVIASTAAKNERSTLQI